MDLIDYSNFSVNGVAVTDTFEAWRRKTNGTISRLNSIIGDVANLYNSDGTAIRYVTTDSSQTIIGTKTFSQGTAQAPTLKIDVGGLYYDSTDSSIATTVALKTPKIISSGSEAKFGNYNYTVPSSSPGGQSLLSKNGSLLSWTTYSSLVSEIKTQSALNVVTTNIVLPVGTIQTYISAASNDIPQGWLSCDGGRFKGGDYPELAQLLLSKYGPIYPGQTATAASVPQNAYNANYWYTLPDMRGRIALGVGTGTDTSGTTQAFNLGAKGGKYSHTLIIGEMPSHSHTMDASGVHRHDFNLNDENNYSDIIAFGRSDINRGLTNDGTGYANDGNKISGNDKVVNIVPSGSHTHTINSIGGGAAHPIMQPYLVTHFIIKAKPDNVLTSQIIVGSGLDVIRNGLSENHISITDSANSTISIKYDSTLKISNGNLGLNVNSVNSSNIVNASIAPEKLTSYGPSWGVESGSAALFEGSGENRKRVATRDWVNTVFIDGPVKSLISKNPGQQYTSSLVTYNSMLYAYIDKDGVPCMTGHNEFNALATSEIAGGYTPYPLPLDSGREITAEQLWVTRENILALGSNGKLYARGRNSRNEFNLSTYTGVQTHSNWVLAFDQVYSYDGETRTIQSVIVSPEDWGVNIAVIDSNDDLWIAGNNQYGQLGNGTTTSTNLTTSKHEEHPALLAVKEAVMVGGWNGTNNPVTIAAIQWNNRNKQTATVRAVGYGANGQTGEGSVSTINVNWTTASIPSAIDPKTSKLYVSGNNEFTSLYLVAEDGSMIFGWGYNSDLSLGYGTPNQRETLPVKIWDATNSGIGAQQGRFVEKFYTTSHEAGKTSNYILTQPVNGKREIWAAGVNMYNKWGITSPSSNEPNPSIWINITPEIQQENWYIDDFFVGNSYDSHTNNFIKWKIVHDDEDVYQLEASGWSREYSTGTGLNDTPLLKFTRVNLISEVAKSIIDVQSGRSGRESNGYTYLLSNDGKLYFSGKTRYQCNPLGIEGYSTPNFIRIK